MIHRFLEVVPDKLYRGSAPTPQDIATLKKKFNINKVVSLDGLAGQKINKACHLLGIKHVNIPININTIKKDLLKLFQHDLKELLLDDCPTFIHCQAGKDRTGLVCALFKCQYLNEDPETAIQEAKEIGLGIGIDPKITSLFEKLIRSCKPQAQDTSTNYNIVTNEREYISDNRSSFLDEGHQGSFAPHLDKAKYYPMDALYNYINDQSPTRENYQRSVEPAKNKDIVPLVGLFNNDAGIKGVGPVENYSGFFYD